MAEYVSAGGLEVAKPLYDLVRDEIAPGTGIAPEDVWKGLGEIIDSLAAKNRQLLDERDRLQERIDAARVEQLRKRRELRRGLAGLPGALRLLDVLPDRRFELVMRHDRVDQADRLRLWSRKHAAGEDQPLGQADADAPRRALGTAEPGVDPDPGFREGDGRGRGGDAALRRRGAGGVPRGTAGGARAARVLAPPSSPR